MLRFMGSQRVGHNWASEQNWTEMSYDGNYTVCICFCVASHSVSCLWNSSLLAYVVLLADFVLCITLHEHMMYNYQYWLLQGNTATFRTIVSFAHLIYFNCKILEILLDWSFKKCYTLYILSFKAQIQMNSHAYINCILHAGTRLDTRTPLRISPSNEE